MSSTKELKRDNRFLRDCFMWMSPYHDCGSIYTTLTWLTEPTSLPATVCVCVYLCESFGLKPFLLFDYLVDLGFIFLNRGFFVVLIQSEHTLINYLMPSKELAMHSNPSHFTKFAHCDEYTIRFSISFHFTSNLLFIIIYFSIYTNYTYLYMKYVSLVLLLCFVYWEFCEFTQLLCMFWIRLNIYIPFLCKPTPIA